ncbi:sodium:calcium antiporter [Stakelama saccharophila]|uniref:Sodium/calcium exchanger membrane region domain-containing protein n=1 Tax=Stakelama saccharophila TaxID=3075605 RepID=A0ABZ0B7K0_9SPHN|nr:hypothetical protein [Stakelama sp. W311]WNO53269.1 hypothetical protein RPR59_12570 [Stakelama sp. W311]
MSQILLWTAVAIVGALVIWTGSGLLERSSERLAEYYRLPEIVKGAVVVAVGSSFPELTTTVLSAALHGAFELGVAAIVGSALFNILVIPAMSRLFGGRLEANRDLVYKESQFYMIAVAVLLLAFSFAVIYHPRGGAGALQGEMTRPLALLPLLLYLLYIFVQYQDAVDDRAEEASQDIRPLAEWGRLALSLVLIVAGVEALVRAAINFGDIFATPGFVWGFTVVAAGTSVPDAFVSVRAARGGQAVTSLSNVLGSNIFDLLVCIPAGILIAGAAVIDFAVAAPLMAVLTVATIALFLTMRTNLALGRGEAVFLLALYGGIVAWICLESFGAVDFVPGLPPSGGAAPP